MSRQALGTRIRLHGNPDAFGDEGPGDLQEAVVLHAHQVLRGTLTSLNDNSAVSEERQPILSSRRLTSKPGVPFSMTSIEIPAAPGTGADGGDDIVAAHRGGDVGLGSVDDVGVPVANRRRPQMADVGAAAGFGDRQRADQLPAGSA